MLLLSAGASAAGAVDAAGASVTVVEGFSADVVTLGAVVSFGFAWDMADICQCMLAFINIPSCVLLGGVAYRALDDYTAQKKEGKNPTYKAAANGVKEKTDFWT